MKVDILKKIIKDAVKEAIHEELKDILLEAMKGNKQPINESEMKTLSFTTKAVPHQQASNFDSKKAYMDILNETAKGPESGFDGEFKPSGPIDPVNGSLPNGELGLDQILKLVRK